MQQINYMPGGKKCRCTSCTVLTSCLALGTSGSSVLYLPEYTTTCVPRYHGVMSRRIPHPAREQALSKHCQNVQRLLHTLERVWTFETLARAKALLRTMAWSAELLIVMTCETAVSQFFN